MPNKAKAKMLHDTCEQKTHYKLYKKGRNWTIAGLTVLFSGMLLAQHPQIAHADEAETSTPIADTTGVAATPDSTVALTPSTVATIGSQTITTGDTPTMPTVTLADGEVAPSWTTSDFDFSKVDTTAAGTYAVTLSATGLKKLQAANAKQTITASHVVAGSVTVTAAKNATTNDDNSTTTTSAATTTTSMKAKAVMRAATATSLQVTIGDVTKAYDGKKDNPTTVTVTLSAGMKAPSTWYYTGTANTYQLNVTAGDVELAADGQPGTSLITLSDQGLAALKAANSDTSITADNVIAGTLTITKKLVAAGSITIADQSKAYDQNTATDPMTYQVTLPDGMTAPSTWKQSDDGTYALTTTDGDITVADDSSQAAGDYAVNLSAQALADLQAANPTLDVTASVVATGKLTIVSVGNVTVGTTTVSVGSASLPATITVTMNNSLKVPEEWTGTYKDTKSIVYEVPLTTDNFDLSQVQLASVGSYEIALSSVVKAELQALNADVVLDDNAYQSGKIIVAKGTTSSISYSSSWLYISQPSATMAVGQAYNLNLGVFSHNAGGLYDGLTEYVILPTGFHLATAIGSNTISTTPAATLQSFFEQALAPSASNGYTGVTVTQLADFHGRQTFQVTVHADGSNQDFNYSKMSRGAFSIPIVVDDTVAGTTVQINSATGNLESGIVYITDDPSVTGGTYKLTSMWGYGNVPSVAASLGVLTAYSLLPDNLSSPFTVKVIAATVKQIFNLTDPTGKTIGSASTTGVSGSTYVALDVLPHSLTVDGVTYLLDTTQLAASDILTPGAGQQVNTSTGVINADTRTIIYRQVLSDARVTVADVSKDYDGDATSPATYTVTLPAGVVAPADWKASGTANEYLVAATSDDLDLSAVKQTVGTYTVTLSDTGLAALAAANPNYLFGRDVVSAGSLTITAQVQVNFNYPSKAGTAFPATQTLAVTASGQAYSLGYGTAANKIMIPMMDGYDAVVVDDATGKETKVAKGTDLAFTSDGTTQTYTVNYVAQHTVTVQYVLEDGQTANAQQADITNVYYGASYTTTLVQLTGLVVDQTQLPANATGTMSDSDVTVTYVYKALGHYLVQGASAVQYANAADSAYDAAIPTSGYPAMIDGLTAYANGVALTLNADGTTYAFPALPSDVTQDTVITYQPNAGVHMISVTYNYPTADSSLPTWACLVDKGTETDYTFSTAAQTDDNLTVPTVANYYATVTDESGNVQVFNPAVGLTFTRDGQDHSYTVDYVFGSLVTTYYKDEDFNDIHAPLVVPYNMGDVYTHTPLAIEGYVLDPAYIGQGQAESGNDFGGYYDKWYFYETRGSYVITTPTSDTASVIPYPDDPDHPGQVNAPTTGLIPYVAGYTPHQADGQALTPVDANDLTQGYLAPDVPDDPSQDTPISYTRNATNMTLDTVSKTVHYVDQDGNAIDGVDDVVSHVNFSALFDEVTGLTIYGPESAILKGVANPTPKGYTVDATRSDVEATQAQTVKFGDTDLAYTVVLQKNAPTVTTDTVTKTVHYVDGDGKTLADDYVATVTFEKSVDAVTDAVTYTPVDDVLGHQATPSIHGYHVVTNPAAATSDQTVKYGDADIEYKVVYAKDAPKVETDTVTKTVHYVDSDGNSLADDYVSTVTFEKSTDAVTGDITYTPVDDVLGHQATPTIKGYHVVTNPAAATGDQTVKYGDADIEYSVVYTKDDPKVETDTVTKTVHYVDGDGNSLADDYVSSVTFEKSTDAVTGDTTYTPVEDVLGYQATPSVHGYHVVTNPSESTSDQTVKYGDADVEYKVVYAKNAPKVETDTVTKTVHYVDDDGNPLADDYVSSVTFEKSTDAVTGDITYTPVEDVLGYQATPSVHGYHVVTNPAEATSNQTVQYGDDDAEYKVVYAKDAPKVETDTVTKTVHYVDDDGNPLADDYVSSVTFEKSTDAVTGNITYTPVDDVLGHQSTPSIHGYHVVANPAAATSDQTVKYGDDDAEYTVVYAKDAPKVETSTVTKTVHYVDGDGNKLADDYVSTVTFEKSTDAVTGDITYTPVDDVLGHQTTPSIHGYHVVTNPSEATSDQTVRYGDDDAEYTVIYAKDAPKVETSTVTKTVHYVDGDGNKLADDYVSTVTFEKSTDAVTGDITYTPVDDVLGHQATPSIHGYHVVTNPSEATSDQTVKYGDADTEYKVVYAKDNPAVETSTVTKTVHYVDGDGNSLADDYVSTVTFEKSIDAVTGEVTYTPIDDVLGHQATPSIHGYHVVTNPAEATSDQTVKADAESREYSVVYEKDAPSVTTTVVTKTVHYVDGNGKQLADDFTTEANFTISTDAVTGAVTVSPTSATLAAQANPAISGYHIVTDPADATASQLVRAGDDNIEVTVVYAADQTLTTPDQPSVDQDNTSTSKPRPNLPSTSGNQLMQVTQVTNQHTTSTKAAAKAKATITRTSLPSTGDHTNSPLVVLGAGLIALFGLAGKRRKHD